MNSQTAQEDFFAEHPEIYKPAMRVVNEWGKGKAFLPHLIGEALLQAHLAGQRGEPLPFSRAEPSPLVLRRSRVPQSAVRPGRVVRRTR
jgi:hypothetical protein